MPNSPVTAASGEFAVVDQDDRAADRLADQPPSRRRGTRRPGMQANPTAALGDVSLETGRVARMSASPPAYEYIVRVTWMPSARTVGVETLNRA